MKRIITLLFVLISHLTYAQDSNVLIGLAGPAYGVKVKNNFPLGAGGFARAFSLSNQDASENFISMGVLGAYSNGISTMTYGYIGQSHTNVFMSFKADGNIGIGTLTPNAKLTVNGNIRAKEIKVETANWPDYVFARDYKLPSLDETEQHIKEKGHLLGIPSAKEVKENGVELGEMNKKLLLKIEELTLHLIEQNKQLELQNRRINELEKRSNK